MAMALLAAHLCCIAMRHAKLSTLNGIRPLKRQSCTFTVDTCSLKTMVISSDIMSDYSLLMENMTSEKGMLISSMLCKAIIA